MKRSFGLSAKLALLLPGLLPERLMENRAPPYFARIADGEKSYALGKEGSARRNLSVASGPGSCSVGFTGNPPLFTALPCGFSAVDLDPGGGGGVCAYSDPTIPIGVFLFEKP